MKKVLVTVLAGILSSSIFCLSAMAQAEPLAGSASLDLLIKGEVETAVSMLQAIYEKHQRGEMTLDQAKELGAELLRNLKYGTDGYFWADTTEGVNVVLYGRKDVEGTNRLESTDAKGAYFVKEFLAKAKSGGGYVDYWFTKKGQAVEQPKRSYLLLFKPFEWAVGSDYYY